MSDEPQSERLGLRGTLDLISNVLRAAGTANATGAITAGASYRFFSDKPDLQWAMKHITLLFLFGVATFAVSYIELFWLPLKSINPWVALRRGQNGRTSCGLSPRKQPQSMARLLSEHT